MGGWVDGWMDRYNWFLTPSQPRRSCQGDKKERHNKKNITPPTQQQPERTTASKQHRLADQKHNLHTTDEMRRLVRYKGQAQPTTAVISG